MIQVCTSGWARKISTYPWKCELTRDNHPVHLAKISHGRNSLIGFFRQLQTWTKQTLNSISECISPLHSVLRKNRKPRHWSQMRFSSNIVCCSEMLIVAFLRCIVARLFVSPQLKRRSWVNDHRKPDNYKRLCKTGSLLLDCQGSKANETGPHLLWDTSGECSPERGVCVALWDGYRVVRALHNTEKSTQHCVGRCLLYFYFFYR